MKRWKKFKENAFFRSDGAYAGKDHTKRNKTFICLAPYLDPDGTIIEYRGFKTIEAAMKKADSIWS